MPLGFVLVDELNVRTRPDVQSEARYRLSRYAVVRIWGVETTDGETWYRIGHERYVKGEYVRVLVAVDRPGSEISPDRLHPEVARIVTDLPVGEKPAWQGGRIYRLRIRPIPISSM